MSDYLDALNTLAFLALAAAAVRVGWYLPEKFVKNWSNFLRRPR